MAKTRCSIFKIVDFHFLGCRMKLQFKYYNGNQVLQILSSVSKLSLVIWILAILITDSLQLYLCYYFEVTGYLQFSIEEKNLSQIITRHWKLIPTPTTVKDASFLVSIKPLAISSIPNCKVQRGKYCHLKMLRITTLFLVNLVSQVS